MDLDSFARSMTFIDLKSQTIGAIAENCIRNGKDSEKQIAMIIDKQAQGVVYVQKLLAILCLVSQILLRTGTGEKKEDRFFKPLAPKAKTYVQELSRRVKQIKSEHIQIVPQILVSWSAPGNQIFAQNFMQKLRKISEPIMQAAHRFQQQRKNSMFTNYSKTFLLEYEEARSFQPTSRLYDDYVAFEKVNQQITQIKVQMGKITLGVLTPQAMARAGQLRGQLQKISQKLQDVICRCHVTFKILRQACREQVQLLPNQAKQIYYNL